MPSEKDPDGRVYVWVDNDASETKLRLNGESEALISAKDETIATLREQLEAERQAHAEARRIIAGLVERIPPAIEPPSEASGEPASAAEEEGRVQYRRSARAPSRGPGGGGCSVASEKYPLQAAQRRMLEVLQEKIEEARRGDPWRYRARLTINQVGALGEEIGLDELDAVEMFRRLWREGYFDASGVDRSYSPGLGQWLPFSHANIEGLSEKDLREIGRLPDPGEKLINAFEAAVESIERSDMPEPKKGELLERARLVIDALRTAEGLADLAGRMFGG